MILHAEFVDYDAFFDLCRTGDLYKLKTMYRTFGSTTKNNIYLRKRAMREASDNGHIFVIDWLLSAFKYTDGEIRSLIISRTSTC
jgi:hypothetical protein